MGKKPTYEDLKRRLEALEEEVSKRKRVEEQLELSQDQRLLEFPL